MTFENGVPKPLSPGPAITPSPFTSNASNNLATVLLVSDASSARSSASK